MYMNSEYQITKYKENQLKIKKDLVSIEEPLSFKTMLNALNS